MTTTPDDATSPDTAPRDATPGHAALKPRSPITIASMTPALARTIGDDTMAERERERRQNMRSIAIALALGGLVLLFYAATIVRLGGNVINRAM